MLAVITVTSLANNFLLDGAVTLREAIQAANADTSVDGSTAGSGADTIEFAAALSGETISLGGTELELTEALTVDATTLTGNLTIDANDSSRIFNITATTGDFTLAGLALIDGRTTGDNVYPATTFNGGAIRSLTSGSLTIDRSVISGSSTIGSRADGGGVFSSGAITFNNSTVSGNSTGGSYSGGGGIFSEGAVTITDSIVSGNSTASNNGSGGGIFSYTGPLTITNSTISGNSTAGGQSGGGGIFSVDGLFLTNSTVSGNSTAGNSSRGGGIRSSGDVTLTGSTVSGNSTAGDFSRGGGIAIAASDNITLTNSTVSDNRTLGPDALGGGIYAFTGNVTLFSSTVTDNHTMHANSDGGGIFVSDVAKAVNVDHSIVSGNSAGGGTSPDLRPGGTTFTANHSLLGIMVFPGAGSSDNIFDNNPQLGPLTANGGPTETHALLAGSPAIDAGDPGFDVGAIPNDQRGAPFGRRSGPRVDIGAYERQIAVPLNLTVDTLADENDGDYGVGDLSLREAVGLANGSLGAQTITFAPLLSGETIELGGTEIEITESLTIDATTLAQSVTIDANSASRIFDIIADTGDFTLAGLTLSSGRTIGTEGGGAIHSYTSGNLTLDQSTVSGSSTTGVDADGGGIFSVGSVTLTSSTVSGNSTLGINADGGGIFSFGGVSLTSSTVSGNSTMGDGAGGGGIRSDDLTLSSSTVSGNSTAGGSADGGGIRSFGAVTLTNSTVTGNSTTGSGSVGGGIVSSDSVTLTSSTVSGNSTVGDSADGGGIRSFGAVTLTNSTVSGNSTAGGDSAGGGIQAVGGVSLTNSTVSGNSTAGSDSDGGGIWLEGGILNGISLINSTLTDNQATHATSEGGGIWINSGSIFLPNIRDSILSGNSSGSGAHSDFRPVGTNFTANYSLLGTLVSPSSGSGNIFNNNPQLGPLANNGGPTETHAPLVGSPAIDAGNPSFSLPLDFDQRGAPFVRVFGGRIDIGAVEDQLIPDSADFDSDGDVDGSDFLAWQRGFGTPNAMKTDGDADYDTDVDAADLTVWGNSFGQPQPLVAAASSEQNVVASQQSAKGSQMLSDTARIDAALVLEWSNGESDEESEFVVEPATLEAVFAESDEFNLDALGSAASDLIASDVVSASDNKTNGANQLWFAEELLEREFV